MSDQTPETPAPTQELQELQTLEVKAEGEITEDGRIKIVGSLGCARITVEYENHDEGYLHLDTLFAGMPQVMGAILPVIMTPQEAQQ